LQWKCFHDKHNLHNPINAPVNGDVRMNNYDYVRLAILDYKIDELSHHKKEVDVRLAKLYELRKELMDKINEDRKHVCCNQREMFFDD